MMRNAADPADVFLDNGRVEVTSAPGNSPRCVRITMELAHEAAGEGPAHELSQPSNALHEAQRGLVAEKPHAQQPGLASTKTRPNLFPSWLHSNIRVQSMYQRSPI